MLLKQSDNHGRRCSEIIGRVRRKLFWKVGLGQNAHRRSTRRYHRSTFVFGRGQGSSCCTLVRRETSNVRLGLVRRTCVQALLVLGGDDAQPCLCAASMPEERSKHCHTMLICGLGVIASPHHCCGICSLSCCNQNWHPLGLIPSLFRCTSMRE